VTRKQFLVMLAGLLSFLIISRVPFTIWQKASPYLFAGALVATCLVFVPGLGLSFGGARRWLLVGDFTVQPSEFLKLAFVLYFGGWLAKLKPEASLRHVLVFFFLFFTLVAIPLVLQPDIDTLAIMFAAGFAMMLAANVKWSHLGLILLIISLGALILVSTKPYILTRVKTFFDPARDPLTAGWQINQSLIAVGSGGVFGRGFGQSLQKFKYLPEPVGDSIFAVASEEFGFAGSTGLIILFLLFAFAGLRIANRSPHTFGRLITVGIVIIVTAGSLMNIAAMLGMIPLTGTPLLFVSHGGTALLLALTAAGIILSVSRANPRVKRS
jgi:cell division protein FtsW